MTHPEFDQTIKIFTGGYKPGDIYQSPPLHKGTTCNLCKREHATRADMLIHSEMCFKLSLAINGVKFGQYLFDRSGFELVTDDKAIDTINAITS